MISDCLISLPFHADSRNLSISNQNTTNIKTLALKLHWEKCKIPARSETWCASNSGFLKSYSWTRQFTSLWLIYKYIFIWCYYFYVWLQCMEAKKFSYLQFNFSAVSLDGFPGSFENKNNLVVAWTWVHLHAWLILEMSLYFSLTYKLIVLQDN